jgi:alkanesulfonate monooxygenase SsuD/methylene tetrahydromethanopterin reductase-like flavin-dependent oxidoreductase (luciferase family)
VKIGLTLPSFQASSTAVLDTACAAEEVGIDGVFAFDHLWPGADRSRPALSLYPLLGAVAARTQRVRIGSLVARLGLVPDALVVASLVSLQVIGGGRLLAAIGIGDAKSLSENEAFGIDWPSLEQRRTSLAAVLDELRTAGIECWVGASSPATLEIARAKGATVNLWDVDLGRVRKEVKHGPTTWAGPMPSEPAAAAKRLVELRAAGAAWAIWGWPRSMDLVKQALGAADMQGVRT